MLLRSMLQRRVVRVAHFEVFRHPDVTLASFTSRHFHVFVLRSTCFFPSAECAVVWNIYFEAVFHYNTFSLGFSGWGRLIIGKNLAHHF